MAHITQAPKQHNSPRLGHGVQPIRTAATVLRWIGWIGLFAVVSTPAWTQSVHKTSPHAHARSAEVSGLTADDVRALQNGEGMGLARAADLNHFPGPKHLLDLGAELNLNPGQIKRIRAIHGRMKAQAIAKGEDILEAEAHLAGLFASGRPSAAQVKRITEQIGIMRGQLRAIHLIAHIDSTRELTAAQIEGYDRLRAHPH